MRVGFIGLGRMGAAMATNLVKAGFQVVVYNRTPAKVAPLVTQGAKAASSVIEACQSNAVITMLANDEAVEDMVLGPAGVIANLARGALHVSSSTISVGLTRQLAHRHAETDQSFVAAPVFGRPEAAAARKLFVVAGGDPNAVEVAMPLLQAIGQKTFVVSDAPEAASLVKLAGNFLSASVLESLGEALALVAKGGVDPHRFVEILTSTLFDAPIYRTYGELIASRRFEPAGFAALLGHKDIRLLLAASGDLTVPMPLASLLRDRFVALLARGKDRLDWSAISALAAADAGLSPD
jgi:3-hydroxyisobutyrate dehydrogenase-like beta-hydroxyacid dehydrogenase